MRFQNIFSFGEWVFIVVFEVLVFYAGFIAGASR